MPCFQRIEMVLSCRSHFLTGLVVRRHPQYNDQLMFGESPRSSPIRSGALIPRVCRTPCCRYPRPTQEDGHLVEYGTGGNCKGVRLRLEDDGRLGRHTVLKGQISWSVDLRQHRRVDESSKRIITR